MVFEALPGDVPGYARLVGRRDELVQLLVDPTLRAAVATQGVEAKLAELEVRREGAGPAGLGFIRRVDGLGVDYFLTNFSARDYEGWLELGVAARNASLLDPMSRRFGWAALRKNKRGTASVYLQLASGQSVILSTSQLKYERNERQPAWRYVAPAAAGIPLVGEWQVEFTSGGPALPRPARLRELRSWTEIDDPEVGRFAGTARYRLEFDAPATRAQAWMLDLGDVREAARVWLNGRLLGAAWAAPFTLRIDESLKPRGNVLEIWVGNLPANRIRDLDTRKVDWKIMPARFQDVTAVRVACGHAGGGASCGHGHSVSAPLIPNP